jgi:hypothetical protein
MFNVEVDTLDTGSRQVFVVRDDRLGGGTKERACLPFLNELLLQGAREFLYASPFCGFAQVALAKSAHELGVPCTIFAERDKRREELVAHEFTKLAEKYGANIVLTETLAEAQFKARSTEITACAIHGAGKVFNIPLGFDHPSFHQNFEIALRNAWKDVSSLDIQRLWLPLGSGTFAKCMRKVVPLRIEICLVDVGVLPPDDPRIRAVTSLPNTSYFKAEEKFSEVCLRAPPIPSNVHYDAKLWRFLVGASGERDLWWNVAR